MSKINILILAILVCVNSISIETEAKGFLTPSQDLDAALAGIRQNRSLMGIQL